MDFNVPSYQLYSKPMDMRKGVHSLIAVVQGELGRDATSGDAFVFINRTRKILKVLVAKQQGFWLCQHRLTQGTFQMRTAQRSNGSAIAIVLSTVEWQALLDGVVLKQTQQLRRYGGR